MDSSVGFHLQFTSLSKYNHNFKIVGTFKDAIFNVASHQVYSVLQMYVYSELFILNQLVEGKQKTWKVVQP